MPHWNSKHVKHEFESLLELHNVKLNKDNNFHLKIQQDKSFIFSIHAITNFGKYMKKIE